MPGKRWRRVPVKHEEILRSGLYCSSLSLPVIFRDPPSPMAEINFFIPVCLSKATQDWQGKRQILRLSAATCMAHVRDIGSPKSLQLITNSGGVIIADLGDAGESLLKT